MKDIILIVDFSGVHRGLTDLLQSAGYDVCSVNGGAGARTVTDSAAPGAILLALDRNPALTFSEFQGLRNLAPDVAMIVLSSNSNVRTKAHLLEMGVDDYIEEPFEPLELLARLRSFVRRRNLHV